jgi:hypothetical protein
MFNCAEEKPTRASPFALMPNDRLFALRRFVDRIGRVTVWLADVNGPRGGIDRCCRIDVRLRPTESAFAAETASDAYTAIGRASGRVGRAVARRIGRDKGRRPELYEPGRSENLVAPAQPSRDDV